MRKHLVLVAIGYLVVASGELLSHWLLIHKWFSIPLLIYSLHTGSGGVSVFPDMLFPAIILGSWNGWVGRWSSSRVAKAFILPLAAGIVALLPLYARVMSGQKGAIWWWPQGLTGRAFFLAAELFFATVVVAILTGAFQKGTKV